MGRPCSSLRCPAGVVSRWTSGWSGRLALLAVALGLVLMHHVVGDFQHPTAHGAAAAQPAVSAVGLAAVPVAHDAGQPDAPARGSGPQQPAAGHDTQPAPTAASQDAVLHHGAGGSGDDHGGTLLHLCLATLLSAAVVLLALVLATSRWQLFFRPAEEGVTGRSAVPRAPPTSSRLAQLQLLRL